MPSPELVWIIDDDQSIRWVLDKALAQADLHTCVFDSAEAALAKLAKAPPSAILTDIRMPGMDGLGLLAQVRQTCPQVPVIIMTAHSDLDSAIQSYQGGAFEYLPKPFDVDEAVALVRRALAHAREARAALDNQSATAPADIQTDGLIGEAPAMQEVFRTIGRLSQSHITVLINGASGTGKELVAQALHRHSPRRAAPFIALNMAAIPRDLIESELFGHERGAFTGATAQRQGRFEQAQGGTLFLDEIGDMPLEAQTRLLRVLSEGSFHRVGGHTAIRADVRIIAATHQNLEMLVRQGRFREDLFYRLNVIRIQLPTLSERREDIPAWPLFSCSKARASWAWPRARSRPRCSSTWRNGTGRAMCASWRTFAAGSPSWRPAGRFTSAICPWTCSKPPRPPPKGCRATQTTQAPPPSPGNTPWANGPATPCARARATCCSRHCPPLSAS